MPAQRLAAQVPVAVLREQDRERNLLQEELRPLEPHPLAPHLPVPHPVLAEVAEACPRSRRSI